MCLICVTFVYFYTWANRQKAGNSLLDIHTLVHFRVGHLLLSDTVNYCSKEFLQLAE